MCDTFVALPMAAARGATLFAKNSDRERNEAQVVEVLPRRPPPRDGLLKLTYLTIPQTATAHACLLSRPFWMWGAEMGANEHGVVIGNEALHATIPAQRRRALTGMDLLRLALERAATAAEAVAVIIELLERYGQGGDCGHLGRFYYHFGFIIADPTEAYVLETAGKWWATERVDRVRALSNAYSIGSRPDDVSPAFMDHARANGWADDQGRVDWASRLIDTARDQVSFGRGRCARGQGLLEQQVETLSPAEMMAVLRDHGEAPDWSPANTVGRTICMHAAQGPRRSQSVGSLVSEIGAHGAVHWVTGTSGPCTSLFKPLVLGAPVPSLGPAPTDRYDGASLWWRHEMLHRRLLTDYEAGMRLIADERDSLERRFIERMDAALGGDAESLGEAVAICWAEAERAEADWAAQIHGAAARGGAYGRSWARLNHVAGAPRLSRVAGARPA
jgi:dipeptidase